MRPNRRSMVIERATLGSAVRRSAATARDLAGHRGRARGALPGGRRQDRGGAPRGHAEPLRAVAGASPTSLPAAGLRARGGDARAAQEPAAAGGRLRLAWTSPCRQRHPLVVVGAQRLGDGRDARRAALARASAASCSATSPTRPSPSSTAAARCSATRRSGRASACRCSRRWLPGAAVVTSDVSPRCPRSAATRSSTWIRPASQSIADGLQAGPRGRRPARASSRRGDGRARGASPGSASPTR